MREENFSSYFFQVIKDEEKPQWPHPEEDLVVGSQPITSGYTQHWAYPKNDHKTPDELPFAEEIAAKNPTSQPAVVIDEIENNDNRLELILVKDGHAWAKSESSLANLEDNLTSLIDTAKNNFNFNVEHFMTTERVSSQVEKALDELEEAEGLESEPFHHQAEEQPIGSEDNGIKQVNRPSMGDFQPAPKNSGSSSRLGLIIPAVVILAVFIGAVIFRDKIISKITSYTSPAKEEVSVTPTPTITPTPIPSLDRSQYKVRVLNGTKKTGAAAALADKLKESGWEILSTGNATNSATPQTLVRTKPDLDEVVTTLISDLGSDFNATTSANLKASDKADAEVVIGKE